MLSISELCDGSVYVLLGCPRRPGFFAIAVATAALQLWTLRTFWHHSGWSWNEVLGGYRHSGNYDYYGYQATCSVDQRDILDPSTREESFKCESTRDPDLTMGICLGMVLLIAFQLKQLVAGVQILRQRAFLIGGVMILMPISVILVTAAYVTSTSWTVSDTVKDIVVLLFIMDVDEVLYKAVQFAANETVKKIETDIDNAAGSGPGLASTPPYSEVPE